MTIPEDALKRGEELAEGQLGEDQLNLIGGFHHLTACAGGAQEDIDFYTQVVGQRMVKQTVLFDGTNPVYHLYYADEVGTPGTVFFLFQAEDGIREIGVTGVQTCALPIYHRGSAGAWDDRLRRRLREERRPRGDG